jgi:hypothetical protein
MIYFLLQCTSVTSVAKFTLAYESCAEKWTKSVCKHVCTHACIIFHPEKFPF